HDDVSATVFVACNRRHWKSLKPKVGRVDPGTRFDGCKGLRANADIRDVNGAAIDAARKEHVTEFSPEEGHGLAGADGESHDCSVRSVNAARQIHGVDATGAVHRFDHVTREAVGGAVEARTKQRVDHHTVPA